MGNNVFSLSFKSDIYKIKPITRSIMAFLLETTSVSSEDAYDLNLIFNELLINAVTHGNKEDINKTVMLNIELQHPKTICATIADEGEGFDVERLKSKISDKTNLNYTDGGRGMQIVFAVVDDILYNPQGNKLVFYKKLQ